MSRPSLIFAVLAALTLPLPLTAQPSLIQRDTPEWAVARALNQLCPTVTSEKLSQVCDARRDALTAGLRENSPELLALYRAVDFDAAVAVTHDIQMHQGAGHSVGLHSSDDARAYKLANTIPTSRVIVNQAHTFATGGSFTNGMPFSLSMGCGTWGGNSVNENVNYRHFLQSTKIIREIPSREPSLDDIFADYWSIAGQ